MGINKTAKIACNATVRYIKDVKIESHEQLKRMSNIPLLRPVTVHYSRPIDLNFGNKYITDMPEWWPKDLEQLTVDAGEVFLCDLFDAIVDNCPKLAVLNFNNITDKKDASLDSINESAPDKIPVTSLTITGYELSWFPSGDYKNQRSGDWRQLRSLRLEHCTWPRDINEMHFSLLDLGEHLEELGLPRIIEEKERDAREYFTTTVLHAWWDWKISPLPKLRLLWGHFVDAERDHILVGKLGGIPNLVRCYVMPPNPNMHNFKKAAELLKCEVKPLEYPKGYAEDEQSVKKALASGSASKLQIICVKQK